MMASKSNYNHVFLDMDGVLVDFVGGVMRLFGEDPATAFRVDKWDGICEVLNTPPAALDALGESDMWDAIEDAGEAFWRDLEPYPWARQIVDIVEEADVEYTLLTSPTRHPSSVAGKLAWVRRNFPSMLRRTIITPQKHLLAREDRLLIDDSPHNVQAWAVSGGPALKWPLPSGLKDGPDAALAVLYKGIRA